MPNKRNLLFPGRRLPLVGGLAPPNLSAEPCEQDVGDRDGLNTSGFQYNWPSTDAPGDAKSHKINSDLVSAWKDRIQLLTVVTTFLASIDTSLFSLTSYNATDESAKTKELVYAALAGALIFHLCATILGFIGSFVLVRYRIIDAIHTVQPHIDNPEGAAAGPSTPSSPKFPMSPALTDLPAIPTEIRRLLVMVPVRPFIRRYNLTGSSDKEKDADRGYPSVEAPPLDMLSRCYYSCLVLSALGFALAVSGVMIYAWSALHFNVAIFATSCLTASITAGIWAIC